MANYMGKDGFIWWQGVVEDRYDPLKLGRCRVRVLGYHVDDKKNIEITYADNSLTVKSKKQDEESTGFMHKGISQRAFTRSFCLADDVIVHGAKFDNGMLCIELEKVVPDEKKPKTIKIQ